MKKFLTAFYLILILFILTGCDLFYLFSTRYTCELFRDAIYLMNPDGNNLERIVSLDHQESNCEDDTIYNLPGTHLLSFTPDGNKIIYCTKLCESKNNYLYSVNYDGNDNTLLTENLNVLYNYGGISISCVESKIIFIGNVTYLNNTNEKFSDIFIVDMDGLNLNNITNTYGINEKYPRFLPNGEDIIYTSVNKLNDVTSYSINKLNLYNGSVDTLSFNNESAYNHLIVSPDGTRIFYISRINDSSSFWSVNSDGTNQVQIYENLPSIKNSLSMSSDGLKIVYASNNNLCVINTDGSGIDYLETSLSHPYWANISHNGTKVVYSNSSIVGNIFIMDIDGTHDNLLREGFKPFFSPDDNKIAFSGYYFYKTYEYWE